MIKGAASILPTGSPFYLYGPVHTRRVRNRPRATRHSIGACRDRNRARGLRDLEAVALRAQSVGFLAPVVTEMPGNNLSVVFRRM
jgi:hypothetical protein